MSDISRDEFIESCKNKPIGQNYCNDPNCGDRDQSGLHFAAGHPESREMKARQGHQWIRLESARELELMNEVDKLRQLNEELVEALKTEHEDNMYPYANSHDNGNCDVCNLLRRAKQDVRSNDRQREGQ